MVLFVDPFAAYMKGREHAIDRNWNDLKQYEAVEAARNANDISALDILRQRARFGGEQSIFQNNVDASARANEVQETLQPGLLAQAGMNSMAAEDARSAFIGNRPDYQQAIYNTMGANIGQMQNNAAAGAARNAYLAPLAGEMGTMAGQNAYYTAQANNITAAYAPVRAGFGVGEDTAAHNATMRRYNVAEQDAAFAEQQRDAREQLKQQQLINESYNAARYIPDRIKAAEAAAAAAQDENALAALQYLTEYRATGNTASLASARYYAQKSGKTLEGMLGVDSEAVLAPIATQGTAQPGQAGVISTAMPAPVGGAIPAPTQAATTTPTAQEAMNAVGGAFLSPNGSIVGSVMRGVAGYMMPAPSPAPAAPVSMPTAAPAQATYIYPNTPPQQATPVQAPLLPGRQFQPTPQQYDYSTPVALVNPQPQVAMLPQSYTWVV